MFGLSLEFLEAAETRFSLAVFSRELGQFSSLGVPKVREINPFITYLNKFQREVEQILAHILTIN